MVQGALSSNRAPGQNIPSEYSQNLEVQPEAFMEDDNSDEDIGKDGGINFDNYGSDEKNDEEELVGGNSNELIDLGSQGS